MKLVSFFREMSEGGAIGVPKRESDVPRDALDDTHIAIKVVNQNGADVNFKIKPTTKLAKLMEAYCNRQSVTMSSVRFLFNGERLVSESTANDIGLADGDVIDAVLQQTGGGGDEKGEQTKQKSKDVAVVAVPAPTTSYTLTALEATVSVSLDGFIASKWPKELTGIPKIGPECATALHERCNITTTAQLLARILSHDGNLVKCLKFVRSWAPHGSHPTHICLLLLYKLAQDVEIEPAPENWREVLGME